MVNKGDTTIQTVFWVFVMVIVIFLFVSIFLGQKLFATEEGEELEELLGKNMIYTEGTGAFDVSSNGNNYEITVSNIDFYYKRPDYETKELKFFAVASLAGRVAIAKENNGEYKSISPDDEGPMDLNFVINSLSPIDEQPLLRLTFWEESKCVEDFFDEYIANDEEDFDYLLDRCTENYISAVDIAKGLKGRALFVKFDLGETELWEFHLTDDPNYEQFMNTCEYWSENPSAYSDYCLIMLREEDGVTDWPPTASGDECSLTTTVPGSLIYARLVTPTTYNNIRQGLVDANCIEDDDACDILDQEWTDQNKVVCKNCDARLLTKRDNGDFNYMLKVDLLCDDDGYWVACNNYMQNKLITVMGAEYRCFDGKWWWY